MLKTAWPTTDVQGSCWAFPKHSSPTLPGAYEAVSHCHHGGWSTWKEKIECLSLPAWWSRRDFSSFLLVLNDETVGDSELFMF